MDKLLAPRLLILTDKPALSVIKHFTAERSGAAEQKARIKPKSLTKQP
ncbi:hypothetical protein ACRPHS_21505 (plasmid) [Pantoea allii]|nr:hypothetical protein [Pantoea allii]NQS84256.1 hypothetical protein [Pantoea allii]NQS84486.1 hypothetical protein [Pantoea allii]